MKTISYERLVTAGVNKKNLQVFESLFGKDVEVEFTRKTCDAYLKEFDAIDLAEKLMPPAIYDEFTRKWMENSRRIEKVILDAERNLFDTNILLTKQSVANLGLDGFNYAERRSNYWSAKKKAYDQFSAIALPLWDEEAKYFAHLFSDSLVDSN